MKISKLIISGIATVLIALSSGITWYIQDAGTKTSCSKGFQLMASGDYEGYYKCTTLSGDRYEMCFEVYNSSNTENYWCKKGLLVKAIEEINLNIGSQTQQERFVCDDSGCLPVV